MVASYLDVVAHLQESYLAQEFKMQRIQSAIAQSRCVFVFGSGLVGSAAEAELSKKGLSAVSLTADTSEHILAFNAENLSPATNNQGIIVLVEPDFGEGHLEGVGHLHHKSASTTTDFHRSEVLQSFQYADVDDGFENDTHQAKRTRFL